MTAAVSVDDDGRGGRLAGALAVSSVLHLVLLALLMLPAPPSTPADEPGIAVEIVPAEPFAATPQPPPVPAPTVAARPALAPAVPAPQSLPLPGPPAASAPDTITPTDAVPPGWVGAGRLVAAIRLAEPRNRAAADHIAAMPADLRDEQLCDFEAMEQISRPGKPADQVVAYAFAEPRQTSGLMIAEGAAVRIAGIWFRLAFRCRVGHSGGSSSGRAAVTAFAHRLGGQIPRRDWSDHGLSAAGDD